MAKRYDPVLDAESQVILEPVYSAFLIYVGARRRQEEPQNPDDFKKWDKICDLPDGESLGLEFEVRGTEGYQVWRGPNKISFSERTVHVPERKNESKADLYIAVSPTGSAFAVTTMANVKASPVIMVTAYNEPDFPAYDVPTKLWDFYEVENGVVVLQERTEKERYLTPASIK